MAKRDKISIGDSSNCKDEINKRLLSKNFNRVTSYLIPDASQAFTQLMQTLTKSLILQHFDLECYIRIKTNVLTYTIGGMLNQFTNLGQWYQIFYYSQYIILAKTQYKTHNNKFLTIVKTFETW